MSESDAMRLGKLQSRMAKVLAGLEHPPLGMAAALSEECGEVAAQLLNHHAYGQPLDAAALGDELIDVLVCLLEIATAHQINLEEAARRKLAVIEAKAPGWRKTLQAALKKARMKPSEPG